MNEEPKLDLSLEKLIAGDIGRLRNTFRYSGCDVAYRENIPEHCFFTAIYAMYITEWLWARNENDALYRGPNMGHVLMRALLHDFDEAYSGDMPRGFKHTLPEPVLRSINDHLNAMVSVMIVSPFLGDTQSVQPRAGRATYRIWVSFQDAKKGTLEGAIIEFADFLSVLAYAYRELKMSNNRTFRDMLELDKYVYHFHDSKFDFIRPLVNQAAAIVEDITKEL